MAAAYLVLSASALAAPVPTVLDPVAPGVPGEGRAWEVVTSPDPPSLQLRGLYAISSDGDRVSYATFGPLPDAAAGRPVSPPALSVRGAGGWINRTESPPSVNPYDFAPHPRRFSADFGTSIWENVLPAVDPQARKTGLFWRTPLGDTLIAAGASFVDASADLQHVLFSSPEHLVPADGSRAEGSSSLYESVGGSTPRLVDVANDGTLLSSCGASSGAINQISSDGRRIFFNTGSGCGPTRVFMRVDGTTTTRIGNSQCDLEECGEPADVQFAGATPSGSVVYLRTAERLIDDDLDSLADLYRYDLGSGALTTIPMSWEGEDLDPGNVLAVSADGSRLYFGASGRFFMVDGNGLHLVPGGNGSAQFDADGRYVLYASAAQLVPADDDESTDAYRYDAESGEVTQISTGSQGGDGPFDVTIGSDPNHQSVMDRYRAIANDGRRVFFGTTEQLLPADHNEVPDVYEWAEGRLGLISSGSGAWESLYVNATPDGRTVIFRTADTLVPEDRDNGGWDYYAARIGGGFPRSVVPPACEGLCLAPRNARSFPVNHGVARKIRLGRIDAETRREIAASGWITLLAEVPSAGRLFAKARARIGNRTRLVAAAGGKAVEAGQVRLRMRLSKGARRSLALGRSLRVRLSLRLSGLDSIAHSGFKLGRRS